MWWPSQLLKNRSNPPAKEPDTSFFSFKDHSDTLSVPVNGTVTGFEKNAAVSKSPYRSKTKHSRPRRFFTGQSFARSGKRNALRDLSFSPCATGDDGHSSDESVVIIARTAFFERSSSEKQSTSTSRLDNKVRSGHNRRGSSTSHKVPRGNRNRPHMPFACYSAANNGAIDSSDVDDFMLDLDEAWHPNGYSLEDHTDFLIEMTRTSGAPGQVTVIGPIDNRRPADRVQHTPAPLKLVMQEIESPVPFESEVTQGYPTTAESEQVSSKGDIAGSQSGRITIEGEPRFDTGRFLSKSHEHISGSSSPGSFSLSFPCHKRRRSREFGSESIRFVRPDEATDLSEVYIHLGPVSEIEEKFKAENANGDLAGKTRSLPRSVSLASIPSQKVENARSDKLYNRTQSQSAVHIATLEASSTDESGWFKLARPRHQSWADFSQSFSEETGSSLWKQYNQAVSLPLPEPSFVGVSALRSRSRSSSQGPLRDPCDSIKVGRSRTSPSIEDAPSSETKRSVGPGSRAILDSALLDHLTGGPLPVLGGESGHSGMRDKESRNFASHPFSKNRASGRVRENMDEITDDGDRFSAHFHPLNASRLR